MSIMQIDNIVLFYFISIVISTFSLGSVLRNTFVWRAKYDTEGNLMWCLKERYNRPLFVYILYGLIAAVPILNLVLVLIWLLFSFYSDNPTYKVYEGIHNTKVEWMLRTYLIRFLTKRV
jgi:hypothetical protein